MVEVFGFERDLAAIWSRDERDQLRREKTV